MSNIKQIIKAQIIIALFFTLGIACIAYVIFKGGHDKKQQKHVVIQLGDKAIGYIYCDSVTKTDSVYYIHKDSLTLKLSKYAN